MTLSRNFCIPSRKVFKAGTRTNQRPTSWDVLYEAGTVLENISQRFSPQQTGEKNGLRLISTKPVFFFFTILW